MSDAAGHLPPARRAASTGNPPTGLVLTGERTLPGIPDERYWFERHVVAYRYAAGRLAATGAATVLDAGCGEGYGLAMLAAAGAERVIGADLDATVVEHARRRYAATDPRIEVHVAELMDLPLDDDEVDLTVCLQVIEHLHDVPGFLRSVRRVTRPGGSVLIATPNRLTFTPASDVPTNPFHAREFSAAELERELTTAGLQVGVVLGVHHGPELTAIEVREGSTVPDLLARSDPAAWPGWLRAAVHAVGSDSFALRDAHLDRSLDLIAECRVPEGSDR